MKQLFLLLLLGIITACGSQKKLPQKVDTRILINEEKDSVWICIAKTGANEYVRGGVCHATPQCEIIKKCYSDIRKVKYKESRKELKFRRCEICCQIPKVSPQH